MPTIEVMIAVSLAGFALAATPGPSMLYVLSRTIGQSHAAGFASAFGLCIGGIILAVATAFGLAAILHEFDWMVTVLRYVGSVYLVWLGINMILEARTDTRIEVKSTAHQSLWAIMWQGIVVEVLNPKTVLFFALFLPPFIAADTLQGGDSTVTSQLLVLGMLVPLTAIPSDLVVAALGGSMARFINKEQTMRRRLAWVGGLILIGIALNLHLQLL